MGGARVTVRKSILTSMAMTTMATHMPPQHQGKPMDPRAKGLSDRNAALSDLPPTLNSLRAAIRWIPIMNAGELGKLHSLCRAPNQCPRHTTSRVSDTLLISHRRA